jgi:hypothetical protein
LHADLGAFAADVLVVRRLDQHEVGAGPADFGAGHHQAKMRGLDVLALGLEAVAHGHAAAGLIAAQAFLDAALHIVRHLMHRLFSQIP